MSCNPPPSLRNALRQADVIAPDRHHDAESDGICASATHSSQNSTSDHEPDSRGIPHAVDVDHDPEYGYDAHAHAEKVRARILAGEPIAQVVTYIISNRRIFNPAISPAWRPYTGSNPHDHHVHYSIHRTTFAEQWDGEWWTPAQEDDDMLSKEAQDWLDKRAREADERAKAREAAMLAEIREQAQKHNSAARDRDKAILKVLTEISDKLDAA